MATYKYVGVCRMLGTSLRIRYFDPPKVAVSYQIRFSLAKRHSLRVSSTIRLVTNVRESATRCVCTWGSSKTYNIYKFCLWKYWHCRSSSARTHILIGGSDAWIVRFHLLVSDRHTWTATAWVSNSGWSWLSGWQPRFPRTFCTISAIISWNRHTAPMVVFGFRHPSFSSERWFLHFMFHFGEPLLSTCIADNKYDRSSTLYSVLPISHLPLNLG